MIRIEAVGASMRVSSVFVKNMPGLLFWIYLPYHFVLNVFAVIWYALKGRWRVILKAKWEAIIELCENALRRSTLTPCARGGLSRFQA